MPLTCRTVPQLRIRGVVCLLLHCLLLGALAGAASVAVTAQDVEQELPSHTGNVNDFANVLTPAQRQTLEVQLAELERATSAEVALVTMQTVGSRSIEQYANTLFNTWGIGKKDRDNGLLVLVAVQDRAMRIEVGYGLEGILPDGLAGAVMRETFLPRFREGQYATGVVDGMARVIDIVRRNETLTAEQRAELYRQAADASKSWVWAGLAAIFVAATAFALGTAAGAKVISQLVFGLCFTAGILYFSGYVVPRAAVWMLSGEAAGVAVLGLVLGRRPKWRRSIRGTGKGAGGNNWLSDGTGDSSSSRGGSSSSGGSGGSSSSGSFGGGSSGGGGATGRW